MVATVTPPEWGDVPKEFQPDLQDLDTLTDEALHQLASASKIESELDRYEDLLELNAAGSLSILEQQELKSLRRESERFMLRKAQAAVLIRWRAYKV
jgi:hypothetical protein